MHNTAYTEFICHQILQHFINAKCQIIQDNGSKLIKFACITSVFIVYVGLKNYR
jgi:hypothetical protein